MRPKPLFPFFSLLLLITYVPLKSASEPPTSKVISIIGSVFCDSCSDNTFSKRSYFLKGVEVQISCKFKARSSSPFLNYTTLISNKITDQYGVYKLDVPEIKAFRCKKAHKSSLPCKVSLLKSSSSICNVTNLKTSTTYIMTQPIQSNLCIINMNAMSYKPGKRDYDYCGPSTKLMYSGTTTGSLDSSNLFPFWPLIPPFLIPWLHWPPLSNAFPPLPFPFNVVPVPDPATVLPFVLPPWLVPFLNLPSSLPFPFSLFPPFMPGPVIVPAPPLPPN